MPVKTVIKTYNEDGRNYKLVINLRYDDECKNGHDTFSITADLYNGVSCIACGCMHDDIAKHAPELAHLIKWHLCSDDGPLHYPANPIYLAGDRDHWGLRKGEVRQLRNGKTGKLSWKLETDKELDKYVNSDEQPVETATLRYVPWNQVGEGKERELDAARRSAIWPEATDEELSCEKEELKAKLMERLPDLIAEFKKVMAETFELTTVQ